MRYARRLETCVGLSPQPRKIGLCAVKAPADNLGVYGVTQLVRAAALRQRRAERRGIHRQGRFGNDLDPRAVCFAKMRCIPFDLRHVAVGAGKRCECAQRKKIPELMPLFHIEKHVRSDKKI